ncbi:MAG TPA: hypothetical protein VKA51_10485 [Rubrobacteraceae bacterium]|nr:hypothetical protein [Rubrobacteraceae bacterium]
MREPDPVYGYTYGQPSGNRVAEGQGRLLESRPVDVRLGGEPLWVVGVPMVEDDIGWIVALRSGRLETFRLDAESGEVEPWLVAPDELPAGAPPLVVSRGEDLRLLAPPTGSSPLTHPVPLDERPGARLLTVAREGQLSVVPGLYGLPARALPDARAVRSEGGEIAVLSDPTGRYDHGILGDGLEAGSLTVLRAGAGTPEVVGEVRPESGGVFESLAPLWFEAGPDGEELLAVTESTADEGSRISAYRPDGALAAAGPFVGKPARWRHLLAAGPFGPAGGLELAATRTPHLGGEIEFYRPNLETGKLEISATMPGYATHTIYSRNLDAARAADLDGDGAWELLVPNQAYTELAAIRRTDSGAEVAWTLPVGGALVTNLASATDASDRISVAAGRADGFLRVWR